MVTRVLEKSAIYWPPAPHLKERLESAPVVQPGGRGGFNYFEYCLASWAEQGIVRGMKCGALEEVNGLGFACFGAAGPHSSKLEVSMDAREPFSH